MRRGQVIHWKKQNEKLSNRDRMIRYGMVINTFLAAVISISYMLLNKQAVASELCDGLFVFCYVLPTMLLTVMYGLMPAMASFSIIYILALIMMPGAAYLCTMHLVCILLINLFHQRRCFEKYGATLVAAIQSIVLTGTLFFLLYGLVSDHSLHEFNFTGIMFCWSDEQAEVYNRLKILVRNLDRDRILTEMSADGMQK